MVMIMNSNTDKLFINRYSLMSDYAHP